MCPASAAFLVAWGQTGSPTARMRHGQHSWVSAAAWLYKGESWELGLLGRMTSGESPGPQSGWAAGGLDTWGGGTASGTETEPEMRDGQRAGRPTSTHSFSHKYRNAAMGIEKGDPLWRGRKPEKDFRTENEK